VSSKSTRGSEGPGDCRSGVLIAEEVDEAGDKGSGDTTMVNAEAVLEAFLISFIAETSRPGLFSATSKV
jgi:hypothetical protein